MSTSDLSTGIYDGGFQKHSLEYQVLSKVVDFAKFVGTTDSNGTNTAAAGVAGNTADVITIPAGFVVEDVLTKVVTAGTAASTVAVGDTADAVYYLASVNSAATAATIVKTGDTAGAGGKFKDVTSVTTFGQNMSKVYSTASKLVVTLGSTAPTTGKMQFTVRGYSLV